jgi:serine/threonine protein phosphatase PrpC
MDTPFKISTAQIVSGSCIGASHAKTGAPCQDALSIKKGTFRGAPYLICCVADGHGSDEHCYSDQGSLLATAAAEQMAMNFMLSEVRDAAAFKSHVFRHVKAAWIESLRKLTNQLELNVATVRKYGSTLLISLIYGETLYVAQLGDGEIFYLDHNDNPVFLVKPNDGPINPATYSLCGHNTNECWNIGCIPLNEVSFLMLSTDGLINAFADSAEYIKFARILREYLKIHPPEKMNEVLPGWLSGYSEKGVAKDDISLIAINLNPTTQTTGESNEGKTEENRNNACETYCPRRSGRSVCRRVRWYAIRAENLCRVVRYPGAARYYLLSGRTWRSRCKVCRAFRLAVGVD